MHPAKSVILFTAMSGAGYGLLFWFGALHALGMGPTGAGAAAMVLLSAFLLITGGLLSSTLHLGHPERAWRALGQWRSSWLSREGVMALLTYLPWGVFALGWVGFGLGDGLNKWAGLVGSLFCLLTVYATAMIYASLKPIRAWSNGWVPVGYLLLAGASGAALLNAIDPSPVLNLITAVSLIAALAHKAGYWHFLDTHAPASTLESATGLGGMGKVSLFESPESSDGYLMKEMGFQIAREYAGLLRLAVICLGFLIPGGLTGAVALGLTPPSPAAAMLGAVLVLAGVLIERWLFFAEARHTVALYYGRG